MGIAGEKHIFNELVNKYTLKKVNDVTLDGEGYDFTVDDNILRMYEVKSTRIKENDILKFHITIKELKMAERHRSDFYLVVVCYVKDIPQNTYVIPDPLNVIGIAEYAKYVLDYAEKKICIPPNIQVNIHFDKLKKYKNNPL